MRSFWHPLSALYIADLRVCATPELIRMMLRGEQSATLLYGGDRMGPAGSEARRGDSHTRYLTPDGSLRRSFVHYFSPRRLRAELRRTGFIMDGWTGGHVELSLSPGRARAAARDRS